MNRSAIGLFAIQFKLPLLAAGWRDRILPATEPLGTLFYAKGNANFVWHRRRP